MYVLIINSASQLFPYRREGAVNKFIRAILKEMDYWRGMIKNQLNNNSVLSAKDGERFQSSNKCLICDKVCDVGDNKLRDYCHVACKCRGFVHRSFNINLKLTKNVSV